MTWLAPAARLSRTLHGHGLVRGRASRAVRLLARRAAGAGTVGYRDFYGHHVDADLGDYMERCGFFGAHSVEVVRCIRSLLRPGDWAIDAGANVGLVASPMAATVGATGVVWAVEPLPRNVERLRRLKHDNDLTQLEVFPLALAAARSTAALRVPAATGGSGFGSFVATWETAGTVEVETVPLDDLVAERGPDRPLRLLKIDVEGYEREVVTGARHTLAVHRPLVLCELHDQLLGAAGTSSNELLALLASLGYVPRRRFGPNRRSLTGAVVDVLLVAGDDAGAPGRSA